MNIFNKYFYLFIKRLFDIIISFFGCILLIPISIIVKIAYIMMGDFHSIIYTQYRYGKNGKIFKLYKFRTMIKDADNVLKKLMNENTNIAKEYNKNKKLKNDPRITKVGKILRICSIDEFPQFFNILKNDMSFIGNRPYLIRERDDMGNYFYDIIKTKPGLTGYWQTEGRSDTSFKRRLKLEKYYSNNYSLLFDLKIFLKTFKVVFNFNFSK